jgi:translation elongation factor EF-G
MARWDDNILIASVPVEKIQGIVNAIDKSTAGTAESSREFKEMIQGIISGKKP